MKLEINPSIFHGIVVWKKHQLSNPLNGYNRSTAVRSPTELRRDGGGGVLEAI